MAEILTFAPERFPILYQHGEPTAVLVDIQTFRRVQLVMDNRLNREAEPEDAIIAASGWLKAMLARIDLEMNPSPDWEKELDAR